MKLRFVEWTESSVPGFPFRPGQVIEAPELTPEMQAWLRAGRATLVRQPGEPDEAVAAALPERAVMRDGGKRTRRMTA
jgi:hypothetical protein